MSDKSIRRWSARAGVFLLAFYMAVAAFAEHRSYMTLIGGICLAYVFVWLGGEIERNKEQP